MRPISEADGGRRDEHWFTETVLPFSEEDVRISYRVSEVLFDARSKFGHIQIMDTPLLGRILIIDGIVQMSLTDEFIYHEMMVNLPALVHGDPRSVLIVGGGDGGAARRALDLSSVQSVVQVEIDQTVIDVCERFLPSVAGGALQDPRVNLIVGDGREFVADCTDTFDIVALDITDPTPGGPSESLLSREFMLDVRRLLGPTGVLATHCGSLLFQLDKARLLLAQARSCFSDVRLHWALIPSFELTAFGFLICSNLDRVLDREEVQGRYESLFTQECRFLTQATFVASATLPPYLQVLLDDSP